MLGKMRLTLKQISRVLDSREGGHEPPYWFWEGELEGCSEGDSYCENCIKELMPNAKYGDNYTGGIAYESDGCEQCQKCYQSLEYTLTDYGVKSEIGHFTEHGLNRGDLKDPIICYELARIYHGLYSAEDKRAFRLLFKRNRHSKLVKVGNNAR